MTKEREPDTHIVFPQEHRPCSFACAPLPKNRVCEVQSVEAGIGANELPSAFPDCIYLGGSASAGVRLLSRPKNESPARRSITSIINPTGTIFLPERRGPCAVHAVGLQRQQRVGLGLRSLQPAHPHSRHPHPATPTAYNNNFNNNNPRQHRKELTTLGDRSSRKEEDKMATPIVVVVPWKEWSYRLTILQLASIDRPRDIASLGPLL